MKTYLHALTGTDDRSVTVTWPPKTSACTSPSSTSDVEHGSGGFGDKNIHQDFILVSGSKSKPKHAKSPSTYVPPSLDDNVFAPLSDEETEYFTANKSEEEQPTIDLSPLLFGEQGVLTQTIEKLKEKKKKVKAAND